MAKTAQLRAAVDDKPERFWIQVQVPVDRNNRQIAEMMDAVRALIRKVNANERSQAAVDAEAAIHDWWAQQQ